VGPRIEIRDSRSPLTASMQARMVRHSNGSASQGDISGGHDQVAAYNKTGNKTGASNDSERKRDRYPADMASLLHNHMMAWLSGELGRELGRELEDHELASGYMCRLGHMHNRRQSCQGLNIQRTVVEISLAKNHLYGNRKQARTRFISAYPKIFSIFCAIFSAHWPSPSQITPEAFLAWRVSRPIPASCSGALASTWNAIK
jgi:hypothetical protein